MFNRRWREGEFGLILWVYKSLWRVWWYSWLPCTVKRLCTRLERVFKGHCTWCMMTLKCVCLGVVGRTIKWTVKWGLKIRLLWFENECFTEKLGSQKWYVSFYFFELGSHLGSQLGSQQTTPRERETPPLNALFLLESGFFDEVSPPLIPENPQTDEALGKCRLYTK